MNISMMRLHFNVSTISEIQMLLFYRGFVYLSGKPMTPHLLHYQGLAVDDYGFSLDALNLGHPRLSLN